MRHRDEPAYGALLIRRYRAEDRDVVRALHEIALRQVGAFAETPEARARDKDLDDVEGVYLAGGGEFLVGDVDGVLVVMGGLLVLDAERGQIKRMRSRPDHQRRGYGRLILLRLEAVAAATGLTWLCLDTSPTQVAALTLYRSHGYREITRARRAGVETIFMEKTLTRDG